MEGTGRQVRWHRSQYRHSFFRYVVLGVRPCAGGAPALHDPHESRRLSRIRQCPGQMVSIHRSVRSAACSNRCRQTTFRNVTIDSQDLEFSDGFVDSIRKAMPIFLMAAATQSQKPARPSKLSKRCAHGRNDRWQRWHPILAGRGER